MCGIVGYIGNKKACPILIDGLLKLEYRGYDSSGISTIENSYLSIKKDIGRVKNLYNLEGINNLSGSIGIAHTRWATHGKPSKENSHPHMDNTNNFSVVHNGIIENYQELRDFLISKGFNFLSQTDTEVIPNLISYYHSKLEDTDDKFIKAVRLAINDLKGSYAIEVISSLYPNNMIVAKKDSPLVIGIGENEFYIASDIPAILSYTQNFYLLEDDDLSLLSRDNIKFYNNELVEVHKEIKNIELDATCAEKAGFEDFMLKEIYEQPKAILETLGSHIINNETVSFEDLTLSKEFLSKINKIYIVACGTAMHAGLATKKIFESLCNIPVFVDIASEFRYRNPIIDSNTLCIFVSQSGETADTIAALKLSKKEGATTIAISNVIGSSITRYAHFTIHTHAGPEIAVASTKAYTSQITLLTLLAIYFAEILETSDNITIDNLKTELLLLPEKVKEVLSCEDEIKEFAKKIYNEHDIFFLGRGIDYSVAMEASLKLKEISYIHSDAYSAGELKHGPIALIENDVSVVGIMTDSSLVDKTVSNLQEVITRGAKVLVITNQDIDINNFDTIIKVPEVNPLISSIISIVPLQLLSYYVSKNKGLDVDKPRNLAKSVTVE